MSNEEIQEAVARAEAKYEMLKDKVHDQYDEIQKLKQERDKYKLRCYKALKMIFDNYGVLDKYEIEMLEDILNGGDKEC